MVQRIVEKIIKKQLEEKTITEKDISIYKYGYTLVCEVIINIIIAVIIGIISRDLLTVFVFLVIYIPLRSFCGGWHADKIWKCTIFSNLILLVMVMIDEYLVRAFSVYILASIFVMCAILIFWLAPIDTKSKPISAEERKVYKKKINMILVVHVCVLAALIITGLDNITFVLTFSYVTQVIMLLLEIINKRMNTE